MKVNFKIFHLHDKIFNCVRSESVYFVLMLDFAEITISETDLSTMQDKTNRHLRLRELLLEHSQDANLIVM